jgi:hypothetical protein
MSTALLVDATAVFAFQGYLKQREYAVQGNINYGALLDSLRQEFPRTDFSPMLAFAAINPDNEAQQKFVEYLRGRGFNVDLTDFRDAFIVPDRESPYQRLSTRITYVAGLLALRKEARSAQRSSPDLVVVTDAFDAYHPLLDYANVRGGHVTIAFFRLGMEDRWRRSGVLEKTDDQPFKFRDLNKYAKDILGVDLGYMGSRTEGGIGLAAFQP